MLKKYCFGEFVKTDAVVLDIKDEKNKECKDFIIKNNSIVFTLTSEDIVYGLGESVRGLNKRGWKYVSWCSDVTDHLEDTFSLYGAHNFLLIDGKQKLGLFFDTSEKITFDISYTKENELVVSMEHLNLDLYVIKNENSNEVIKEFRKLIGKPYLAPLFGFGYQQSRWSYFTKDEVLDLVSNYEKENIPLECVYLDIDYMEHYKDFTVDKEKFSNFKEFVYKLKEKNIHLVPIIDAGVKIEDGYDVCEEGLLNDYFVKKQDGTNFRAAVWPGLVYFPDFLKKDTRKWFGQKYKVLTDLGIDAFWNDMNEPAMFYTPERLKNTIDEISKLKDLSLDDMDLGVSGIVKGMALSLQNNLEDYKKMYHDIDGKLVCHENVHNIYGYNMTRAAKEELDIIRNQRTLLFSRASSIGAHRYGGIWTGDNRSYWSHIELNIKQMPNLNMCGFLYTGADLGGFGADTTEDLLLRWLEFGIFTPLMRNHSCNGTRRQELYLYDRVEDFRNIINLRYALIPYLYSEYLKSYHNDDLMFKPLSFEYEDDEIARTIEDQLLVGDSIMIAPIYKQNQNNRYVYLPEDMLMLRFRSNEDYDQEILNKGHHYITVKLNEVLIFVRKNKSLILTRPNKNVESLDMKSLKVISYLDSKYEYYLDDGISLDSNYNVYEIEVKDNNVVRCDDLTIIN